MQVEPKTHSVAVVQKKKHSYHSSVEEWVDIEHGLQLQSMV